MSNNTVVILGNDHSNTLGLIQSLGISGYDVYASVWGLKTGLIRTTKYLNDSRIIEGRDATECVKKILQTFTSTNSTIPIICSCDGAALELERHKDDLEDIFVFEYSSGIHSISDLQEKSLQVSLAKKAGFNVPESFAVTRTQEIIERQDIIFPCIFKALKSVEGDKGDLTICNNRNELIEKATLTLKKTPRILVQQYIERDYEISILGCALKSGDCIIPCVEDKLTLFPKNVGLECLAKIKPLESIEIISCIKNLIRTTGYVGLFSVEMMHSKIDDKFYFTEINLRNDGAQSFIRKYGVNLPLIHVCDLLNKPWAIGSTFKPGYYLWEIHHLYSLLHRDISFKTWINEIFKARGGLVFEWSDLRPFIHQLIMPFVNKIQKPLYY